MQEVRADKVKIGDHLRVEGGGFVRVAHIGEARWARDGDGRTCLEFFEARNARGGHVIGRSDLVTRK